MMKSLKITLLTLTLAATSLTAFAATEVNTAPTSAQKIGVVTASTRNSNLSSLERALNQEADKAGATSFRIISASGDNHLYGVAELYK